MKIGRAAVRIGVAPEQNAAYGVFPLGTGSERDCSGGRCSAPEKRERRGALTKKSMLDGTVCDAMPLESSLIRANDSGRKNRAMPHHRRHGFVRYRRH